MAGRRFLYGLALLGSLVFYGAYQEWFSWILLQVVLYFPWLSLLCSLVPMLRVKAEPGAAFRVRMGSRERIHVNVSSPAPQPPLNSKIQITKPMTGETWILNDGDLLPTDHCGGLHTQLRDPRIHDYLGLFRFRLRKTPSRKVLVLPEPVKMDIPAELTRYLARSWHPKPGGGFAENHEIRQYHPGDNLNQIHWKLSAKVGKWMLREPMEPDRGRMVLTMDLQGTPAELDRKLGKLLWLSRWLLEQQMQFETCVLTGNGMEEWTIRESWDLDKCMEELLCAPFAPTGSIRDREFVADWQFHIGGEQSEA